MGSNFLSHPATIAVLILIIVLLFGANKLPGAARSLGRSMRIFKSEVKQMKDDDDPDRPSGTRSTNTEPPLEGRVVDDPAARRPEGRPSASDAPRNDV